MTMKRVSRRLFIFVTKSPREQNAQLLSSRIHFTLTLSLCRQDVTATTALDPPSSYLLTLLTESRKKVSFIYSPFDYCFVTTSLGHIEIG